MTLNGYMIVKISQMILNDDKGIIQIPIAASLRRTKDNSSLLFLFTLKNVVLNYKFGALRLIGSRIMESVAYCDQILLIRLHLNSVHIKSFGLLLSLLCWPKVILLRGGH